MPTNPHNSDTIYSALAMLQGTGVPKEALTGIFKHLVEVRGHRFGHPDYIEAFYLDPKVNQVYRARLRAKSVEDEYNEVRIDQATYMGQGGGFRHITKACVYVASTSRFRIHPEAEWGEQDYWTWNPDSNVPVEDHVLDGILDALNCILREYKDVDLIPWGVKKARVG